jgi:tetratricopeptide (TPR) repeat protein
MPISESGASPGGDLAERRLPALLLDAAETGLTGVLHLHRGQIRKSITLDEGRPVAVASSARDETLGQFLRDLGIITAEQHQRALREASTRRRRIGEMLIEIGALEQASLFDALAAQVRLKLVRSLRWPEGRWRFEPQGERHGAAGAPVNITELILRGLKETSRISSPLPPHLAALRNQAVWLNERGQCLRPSWARIHGEDLGSAIPGEPSHRVPVEQLLASGGSERVLALLDALWHCDALSAAGGLLVAAGDRRAEGHENITVTELSDRSRRHATETIDGPPLYDVLFSDGSDDWSNVTTRTGSFPLLLGELQVPDSGRLELGSAPPPAPDPQPRVLLDIYLRFQGATHYEVLGVPPTASMMSIDSAAGRVEAELEASGALAEGALHDHAALPSAPSSLREQRSGLGRGDGEGAVLARAIRGALHHARAVLLDEEARAAYDRALASEPHRGSQHMQAEVAFTRAREAAGRQQWATAIRELRTAVELAPGEATYHAELGWCHYLQGERSARAADQARPHLNQALAIDPDHGAAHEYKGVISAALGTDEVEAVFHLQRALDADPGRAAALDALEHLLDQRGEHRRIERQYRRLLMVAAGTPLELGLWVRMARLYRDRLGDPESARVAFEAAARLAPDDPEIAAILADFESGGESRFHEESHRYLTRWLESPGDPEPGRRLHELALDSQMFDRAFIAASNLVAIGAADARAEETFRRFRPRFVVRAQRAVDADRWRLVADAADSPEIAELMALLAPVIRELAPVTLAELEVGPEDRVADEALPAVLARIRGYVAHVLGVAEPPVYRRADFGQQIHVGGIHPPVLLVGEDIVATPERIELAFRLGRAMSYLRPGRALGGSHPAGFLRQVVLAGFHAAHPEIAGADPEGARIAEAIARLPGAARDELRARLDGIQRRGGGLDLSEWRRALARTANRVGLLLCGDVPAAYRYVRDVGGPEAATELLGFAIDPGFARLRAAMGLSIEV